MDALVTVKCHFVSIMILCPLPVIMITISLMTIILSLFKVIMLYSGIGTSTVDGILHLRSQSLR